MSNFRKRYIVHIVDFHGNSVCLFSSYSFNKAVEFLETCDVEHFNISFYRDIPDYHAFDPLRILEVLNYD